MREGEGAMREGCAPYVSQSVGVTGETPCMFNCLWRRRIV